MAADEVAPARAVWRLGDYHRFAREQIWEVGPVVVEACGISPGQRVLDVAAGSGNVAIPSAQAGAEVVASDITPENFEAGRKEAETLGVALEWVEADAQALPFGDEEFDVVTSSCGIIFAPDHQRVADEMLRVFGPAALSDWLRSRPAVWQKRSSGLSLRTCHRRPRAHSRLNCGAPKHTSVRCSENASSRCRYASSLHRTSAESAGICRSIQGDVRSRHQHLRAAEDRT